MAVAVQNVSSRQVQKSADSIFACCLEIAELRNLVLMSYSALMDAPAGLYLAWGRDTLEGRQPKDLAALVQVKASSVASLLHKAEGHQEMPPDCTVAWMDL